MMKLKEDFYNNPFSDFDREKRGPFFSYLYLLFNHPSTEEIKRVFEKEIEFPDKWEGRKIPTSTSGIETNLRELRDDYHLAYTQKEKTGGKGRPREIYHANPEFFIYPQTLSFPSDKVKEIFGTQVDRNNIWWLYSPPIVENRQIEDEDLEKIFESNPILNNFIPYDCPSPLMTTLITKTLPRISKDGQAIIDYLSNTMDTDEFTYFGTLYQFRYLMRYMYIALGLHIEKTKENPKENLKYPLHDIVLKEVLYREDKEFKEGIEVEEILRLMEQSEKYPPYKYTSYTTYQELIENIIKERERIYEIDNEELRNLILSFFKRYLGLNKREVNKSVLETEEIKDKILKKFYFYNMEFNEYLLSVIRANTETLI